MTDRAQIYLVTPQDFDPEAFAEVLSRVLAEVPVACLRLDLGNAPEEDWTRAANHLVGPCHAHDVALVVAEHFRLVGPLGLDGVHLGPGANLRAVRKELGKDAIVGAFAGATRHQGMTMAEAGADYVSFGPVGDTGALGAGARADDELFQWWSEMIETPVVAEGGLGPEEAARLAHLADFLVPDRAVWEAEDPVAALRPYLAD